MNQPSEDNDQVATIRRAFMEAWERGWSVVPLKPQDKRPAIRWRGYQETRANKNVVDSWLGQWPAANIGIVTGAISGIVVLDVDGLDGMVSVSRLGMLPGRSPKVSTGRGVHYYFKHPGYPVRNFAGVFPGLDFRGDGGYVVGAGSIHPNGSQYMWMVSPEDAPLLDMPDWLLEIVTGEGKSAHDDEETPVSHSEPLEPVERTVSRANSKTVGEGGRGWALAALRKESAKMAAAVDGTKHERRRNSAIALAGLMPAISEQEIFDALYINLGPSAEDKKNARDTIRDGIKYGAARPREIPPLPEPARLPLRNKEPQKAGLRVVKDSDDGLGESDILLTAPLSDTGNAECFAYLYGDDFRYDHKRKKWLIWSGARWEVDEEGFAERAAIETVRERKIAALSIPDSEKQRKVLSWLIGAENASKQRGLLQQAAVLETLATTIMRFDTGLWETGAPNGTLDLQTGDFTEPDRECLITMLLGTPYEPGAECPRWRRFLAEVFADDSDLISYIQRAVGYSLTGDTSEQKMFLCYGSGANGKSVFLETLSLVLGDYAGGTPFATFDAERRNESTNDLAALKGKRFVTLIESDEDRRLAEARIKAVTGSDRVTCRFLHQEFFTYRPSFKLWMAMNHKPIIRGTDRGIWRRILLVPFTQSFEGKEDRTLADTLKGELPGILNWAIEGLRAWKSGGLGTARVVQAATEEYRKESDLVGQWFADCAASGPSDYVAASEAYDSFRNWCKSYGFREPTQTSFGRSMEERGYARGRKSGKRVYEGLILTPITIGDS